MIIRNDVILIIEREVMRMFWIVEYDNGYYRDYENECHLDVCRRYFQSRENAQKEYERVKKWHSEITDPGFETVEIYCEFFCDEDDE